MKYIRNNPEIRFRNHADIVVAGGGPAGFGAAVTAARMGRKVTWIESCWKLGGMWTLGLVNPYFDHENKGGLNAEFRKKLVERGAWGGLWNISFDPVAALMLLDEFALEQPGLDLMLGTTVTDVVMEGDKICGVIVENKGGAQVIEAEIFIDCTGDGDLAARAHCQFEQGRESDGLLQSATMMFRVNGVSPDYPQDYLSLWYQRLIERVGKETVMKEIPFSNPSLNRLPTPGEALFQWTHFQAVKAEDADGRTKAVLEGRRQVRRAVEFLRRIPDIVGEIRLIDMPELIGLRETRRVAGEYCISEDDVRNSRRQEDGICRVLFNVDLHNADGTQSLSPHNGFDVPLRALIARDVRNLLTAGRCICGSHLAHAAYRVTGDCVATGEGAGFAAAAAVGAGKELRALPLAETASKLRAYRKDDEIVMRPVPYR